MECIRNYRLRLCKNADHLKRITIDLFITPFVVHANRPKLTFVSFCIGLNCLNPLLILEIGLIRINNDILFCIPYLGEGNDTATPDRIQEEHPCL